MTFDEDLVGDGVVLVLRERVEYVVYDDEGLLGFVRGEFGERDRDISGALIEYVSCTGDLHLHRVPSTVVLPLAWVSDIRELDEPPLYVGEPEDFTGDPYRLPARAKGPRAANHTASGRTYASEEAAEQAARWQASQDPRKVFRQDRPSRGGGKRHHQEADGPGKAITLDEDLVGDGVVLVLRERVEYVIYDDEGLLEFVRGELGEANRDVLRALIDYVAETGDLFLHHVPVTTAFVLAGVSDIRELDEPPLYPGEPEDFRGDPYRLPDEQA